MLSTIAHSYTYLPGSDYTSIYIPMGKTYLNSARSYQKAILLITDKTQLMTYKHGTESKTGG